MTTPINLDSDDPIAVSFGGGLNSSALLWLMHERGIRPDVVMFADTGAEKPSTYDHVRRVSDWAAGLGWDFVVVSRTAYPPKGANPADQPTSLEDECIRDGRMPSMAYGSARCSTEWKRRPMHRFLKQLPLAKKAWAEGRRVQQWLGIDADEAHRSANLQDTKQFTFHRPLVDWDVGRDECREALARSPFGSVGKSACFFCPSSRRSEILALRAESPSLLERALAIEDLSQGYNKSVRGLGRTWSWRSYLEAEDRQGKFDFGAFPEPPPMPCGCADDSGDDIEAT